MLTSKVNAFHEGLLTEFSLVRIARGFNRGKGDDAPVMCREYLQFLEQQECSFVTASHVFHYRNFCALIKSRKKYRGKGTLGQAQQQHIRYSVQSFYEFLLEAGYMDSIPASGSLYLHPAKKDKSILSKKEVDLLFSEANAPHEKAILALAYGCGLRRSELERLTIYDYRPETSTVTVREGKFFKSRVIPVSNRFKTILDDYLVNYRLRLDITFKGFLIESGSEPIDGFRAYEIVRSVAKRAKVQDGKVGLHVLRNSIAVHMLDRGADFTFVQRFLGHALLDTTMLYTTRRRKRISLKRRIQTVAKYA